MKANPLLPILILTLALAQAAHAATAHIVVSLRDHGMAPVARRAVVLTPIAPHPRTEGPHLFSHDTLARTTDATGGTVFSNVVWGTYRLDIIGRPGASYTLTLGTNHTGLVSAVALRNAPGLLPPNPATNFYTMAQVDALLAGGGGGGGGIAHEFGNTNLPAGVVATNANRVWVGTNLPPAVDPELFVARQSGVATNLLVFSSFGDQRSIDAQHRWLIDWIGATTVNWDARQLLGPDDHLSLNWGTRQLSGHWMAENLTASGTFAGDGSGLTSLNASRLTTGLLPMGRLTTTGTNLANSFLTTDGVGNRSYTYNASALTNLNAANLASGTIPSARLTGVGLTNIASLTMATNTGFITLPIGWGQLLHPLRFGPAGPFEVQIGGDHRGTVADIMFRMQRGDSTPIMAANNLLMEIPVWLRFSGGWLNIAPSLFASGTNTLDLFTSGRASGGVSNIGRAHLRISGTLSVTNGLILPGTNVTAAPAGFTNMMGAQLWSDGTNLWVTLQNAGGGRTTNRITLGAAWP